MLNELNRNIKSIGKNLRIVWIELWVLTILLSVGIGIIIGLVIN